jgi:Flp pilus assembly protein TadG
MEDATHMQSIAMNVTFNRVAKASSALKTRRQRGLAAIEFAFIFPIFFLIFYGIVTYGIIFVAQQSITMAAEEGARAALRYAASDAVRVSNAKSAANGTGSTAAWLGNRVVVTATAEDCPYDASANCFKVTVKYPNYSDNPLVPLLLGTFMSFAVPSELSSSAIIQLN